MTLVQPDKSSGQATGLIRVGDWVVVPNADRIQRQDQELRLEPQVMAVLMILADRAGQVVSRDELEAQAWRGRVVGYDALASTIIKLRKALGDDARQPRYIETVSKKGYRLIAPITQEPGSEGQPLSPPVKKRQRVVWGVMLACLVLLLGGALYLVKQYATPEHRAGVRAESGIPVKRTIMVLPFTSIDAEPQEAYFVDGITDDLITELSGLSGLVVYSSSAANQYKGQQPDLKKIAEATAVDFFVQGTVRKSGERWRLNVKLINAYNDTNLWAGRFENAKTNIFAAQDDITRGIVEALALQLNAQDRRRLGHRATTNFAAYDLFLQGQKLFKQRTREANENAQADYRKAIEMDQNFARAYSALAVSLVVHFWRGWTDTPSETLDRALKMATLATQLDPSSPQAYWALGYAYMYRRQTDKAAAAVEKMLELAPNYADAYGLLALINNQRGDGKRAVELISKGMKLNPYYSWDFPYILGRAYYTLGNYSAAIKPLLDALNRNAGAINPRMFLAAAYIGLGRKEDASWEVEQIRVMSPETSLSALERNYPISDKALFQRFLGQLREAGMPEH